MSTSVAATQTVNKISTTTTLGSTLNPSVFGQSVTFTAAVTALPPGSGIPTGNVTFFAGATPIGISLLNGLGVATLTTASVNRGSNAITAVYSGDVNDLASTSAVTTQVVSPASTTTLVIGSNGPITYGQSATFTVQVTAIPPGSGVPVGTVTLDDGPMPIATAPLNGFGIAVFTTSALSAAQTVHSITAVYNPAGGPLGNFAPSDSSGSPVTQVVNPAPLTITANAAIKVYGAAVPTLNASFSGFVNGDTPASLTTQPTLTTTATAASHVAGNPYTITASGAVDPNYVINYISGLLNVTPAPLTITANNQNKVYGAALPSLTASYTGFVNGDTSASLTTQPILSTAATAASHVAGNPYPITASGAGDSDYVISYTAGHLTVTPAPLTITANSATKPYGAALPTLSASFSGFVNGDTSASLTTQPSVSTTATAASHVAGNPYAITASGAVDSDYAISYMPGQLTVTPVPLTITANSADQALRCGRSCTFSGYSGFVNGDTAASLTTQPSLSTTATASSHVAGIPYAITASARSIRTTQSAMSRAAHGHPGPPDCHCEQSIAPPRASRARR